MAATTRKADSRPRGTSSNWAEAILHSSAASLGEARSTATGTRVTGARSERLRFAADNSERQGYKATLELLESGAKFDAIFGGTDLIAIGAMRALQDAGKRVPDDVSVVGFDDMPLAAYVSPGLTTVKQDAELGAEGLVNGIVGLIKGDPVESTLMAPELVVRQSCGAADS